MNHGSSLCLGRALRGTLLTWLCIVGAQTEAWGQLPAESVLPGAGQQRPQTLPAEATLPAAPQPQPPAGPALPGEDELPPGVRAGDVPGSIAPGAARPWLRLNLPGHTGTVLTLDAGRADVPFIVSGGEDKDVHVWTADGPPENPWTHRRTIRWQVERGDRGRIYAAAHSEHGLAFAGRGAMGGNGEIMIVDPLTGDIKTTLVDTERGHLQVVATLAWSPSDEPRLASIDVEGRLMIWQPDSDTGLWQGRMLTPPDSQRYGTTVADALQMRRRFVKVCFLGPDHVVAARYVGPSSANPSAAAWQLERIDVETGVSEVITDREHIESVTALACTDDGTTLASADAAGRCWLWRLGDAVKRSNIAVDRVPLTLRFDESGDRLLVGTAKTSGDQIADVQIWTTEPEPIRTGRFTAAGHVRDACWVTTDRIAITQDSRIDVLAFDAQGVIAGQPVQSLAAPLANPTRVAFADQLPYRLRVDHSKTADRVETVQFDLSEIQLQEFDDEETGLVDPNAGRGAWELSAVATSQGIRYRLTRDGAPAAELPLDPLFGAPTALAWLADDEGNPSLLAVGTNGRCSTFLFQLADEGVAPLLREFRGHTGEIVSVGFSPDARYLATASSDSTIRVWKTEGAATAPLLANHWGLGFESSDAAPDDAPDAASDAASGAIVSESHTDGPLFFRGVRSGDRLLSIRWVEGRETFAVSDADSILDTLERVPYTTEVTFQFSRNGRPRPPFQSVAAWQPLLSLYIDADRQWAAWTPAGYYDASFHGHRRFGWQLNRGVDQSPDFFTAAQFRKRLERPAVIRQLLQQGNLAAAMRAVALPGPPPGDTALRNQAQLRPVLRLIEPQENSAVNNGEVSVVADVDIPLGAKLVGPKVFANGVAGITQTIRKSEELPDGSERYRWTAQVLLPRDRVIKLQVIAATDAEAVAEQTVTLRQPSLPSRKRRPRMHLIAMGIDQYHDPQIQPLLLATAGVNRVSQLFEARGNSLYDLQVLQLKNARATRAMWRLAVEETLRRMQENVLPDDTVVLYLIGHGIRDRVEGDYYFVTADARYRDVMNDRFGDLLSMSDLAAFARLRCRKVAILDTCHSGAIQSTIRSQDLKAALRSLQDDVVFTLTASEGHEEAVEEAASGLSRFTFRLAEALAGRADTDKNGDGIVSLGETIAYVQRTVGEDSAADVFRQHPTAGPLDLLPYVRIPLTAGKEAEEEAGSAASDDAP